MKSLKLRIQVGLNFDRKEFLETTEVKKKNMAQKPVYFQIWQTFEARSSVELSE